MMQERRIDDRGALVALAKVMEQNPDRPVWRFVPINLYADREGESAEEISFKAKPVKSELSPEDAAVLYRNLDQIYHELLGLEKTPETDYVTTACKASLDWIKNTKLKAS